MEQGKKEAYRVLIEGRVQGVGFRYSTRKEAQRRGVNGWVRNRRDGAVEVECEGDKQDVDSFLKWLRQGPPGARVTDFNTKPIPYRGTYKGFNVSLNKRR
jgi:acylphosphatase